eukprot:TRINITY_DN14371_c0_g1_i1.p1 TRINITY_DN14371_c0_g1~~TRINITY_DN14371_c0_g1_i1.p1  ORF type:complete len:317 (-),score=93.24 TRINITY_DN14371_c0_g1_i1:49-999(-)
MDAPWFFVEAYFYRRFMHDIDFFHERRDPFEGQKMQNLVSSMDLVRSLCEAWARDPVAVLGGGSELHKAEFVQMLHGALWGNRADLSLTPEGVGSAHLQTHDADRILIDDSETAWERLGCLRQADITVISDNAGFETFCDLAFFDLLTRSGVARRVTFQLKAHPTFVSDAMIKDFELHFRLLEQDDSPAVQEFAKRWRGYVTSGQWVLTDDYYWNSPEAFWEGMPDGLRQQLAASDVVVIKGDANYRRVHGDRHWPFTFDTRRLTKYFPAPFLLLRTLKSEVQTGLSESTLAKVQDEPGWLTCGKYGVIQFIDPTS